MPRGLVVKLEIGSWREHFRPSTIYGHFSSENNITPGQWRAERRHPSNFYMEVGSGVVRAFPVPGQILGFLPISAYVVHLQELEVGI